LRCSFHHRFFTRRRHPGPPLLGSRKDYQKDSAWFDPTESRPYSVSLYYEVTDLGPFYTGPHDVDFELIKKIWGIDDLATLNGHTFYSCKQAGDETVDSIDEIAVNAFARLTPEELLSLQMVSPDYEKVAVVGKGTAWSSQPSRSTSSTSSTVTGGLPWWARTITLDKDQSPIH
jgi:hypothetical protein